MDVPERLGPRRRVDRTALMRASLQHQLRPEIRADHRAERVERLREDQPEMARLRRSKRGGKRVGGDLERGDPAPHDEQAEQDQLIGLGKGREQDDQAGREHRRQRQQDGADMARFGEQGRGGQRDHPVTDEEGELGEQSLAIGKAVNALHRRDQGVDHRSDEAPCEEQAGHHNDRAERTAPLVRHPRSSPVCSRYRKGRARRQKWRATNHDAGI